MKNFLIALMIFICVITLIPLAVWGICELAGSESYSYRGYITNISENEKGETVITALSDTNESEFTIKWYTIKRAPTKKAFDIGDRILLSTSFNSDNGVKKIKVKPGYSTTGILFYAENLTSPFILVKSSLTGFQQLVSVVTAQIGLLDAFDTGDLIRVYHDFPATPSSVSVTIDAAELINDGSSSDLTADDIKFIESKGYKVLLYSFSY